MADYTLTQLYTALRNAHEQGDTQAAQRLASIIKTTKDAGSDSWSSGNPYGDAVDEAGTSYIREQAKMGIADLAFNVVNTISQPLAAMLFDLPMPTQEDLTGALSREEVKRRDREYQIAIENSKKEFAEDLLSYAETAPDNTMERLAGLATRTIAGDPVMSVVGAKGKLGVLTELAATGVSTMSGAMGGELAQTIGERKQLSETATNVLSGVLSTVFGVGGYAAAGGVTRAGTTGVELLTRQSRNTKKALEKVDEASSIIADNQISTMIKKATTENPNLADEIKAAQAFADVPELILPLAALAYDNQIIKKNVDSLMQSSAEFRGRVIKNLKENTEVIKKRSEQLFGEGSLEAVEKNLLKFNRNYGSSINNVQKRINKIDDAIENAASKLRATENSVSIGERTKALLEAKREAVGAKASLKYQKVINTYEGRGVSMPGSSVRAIYRVAEEMKAANAFQDMPRIVSKIKKNFSPEVRVVDGRKTRVFKPTSLTDVDSLKREINKTIRGTKDNLKRTNLYDLKAVLKREISNTDPSFAKEYFGVDEWYYKNAGIPLNSQGLKTLDAKKFAEEAGTLLLKKEVARDFLGYTGAEGVPIVKEALLLKLGDDVFKEGFSFDTKKYRAFLNKNKETIDAIPGFKKELTDVGGMLDSYVTTRNRLNEDYARVSKKLTDNMFSAVYNKGLNTVVNEILSKPSLSEKYFDSLSNLTANESRAAKQSVRAVLLSKALDSDKGTLAFLNEKRGVYDKWMGAGYVKKIEKLGAASDIIGRIKPENIRYGFTAKQEDALAEATGSSFPNLGSLFRDRISSGYQKVSILLSRFFAKKTHDSRDSALSNLLLDTDALDGIIKVSDAYKANKVSSDDVKAAVGALGAKIVFKGGYFGASAGETVQTEEMTRQ